MSPERAAKLIAMMCAKVSRFEPSITAFDALQRYDVVQAVAMVKSMPAQMLIRIKYADDVSNIDTFEDQLCAAIERGMLRHVEQFAAPQRWKSPRKDFLRDLCRLAIAEHLSPKLCWFCRGHGGGVTPQGQHITCDRCSGSGEGRPSERKRARFLNIDESAWKHSWRARYRVIQGVLDTYEEIGLKGVAKRLSL